jgi:hypothetical protein
MPRQILDQTPPSDVDSDTIARALGITIPWKDIGDVWSVQLNKLEATNVKQVRKNSYQAAKTRGANDNIAHTEADLSCKKAMFHFKLARAWRRFSKTITPMSFQEEPVELHSKRIHCQDIIQSAYNRVLEHPVFSNIRGLPANAITADESRDCGMMVKILRI